MIDTLDWYGAYIVFVAAVIGLLFGSFLNCTAMRIVRGEDWVKGRSRCPRCSHELGVRDLVPVFSFIFSRGRCRYCGEKISIRYPATELLFSGITVALVCRFSVTAELVRYFVFACVLFVLSITDIEDRTIPNGCLIVALIGWFATEPFLFKDWRDFGVHVAAMICFAVAVLCLSLIMDMILKKESLGGGDVKLIGVLGLYLGVIGTMFMLILASVLGLVYAFMARKLKRGQTIAFGPFLAAAGFVMAVWGAPVTEWYLGLLY